MKQIYLLLSFFLLLCYVPAAGQTYILNEDFSSASEATPPTGWTNITVTGVATDRWRFDNLGTRAIPYPFTGKFAIFDSDNYSPADGAENVVLESKFFDASISNNTLLTFDHFFSGGKNGSGTLEVFNGTSWSTVATFTDSTALPESKLFNLSAKVGGVTNAKVRFRWTGNASYFWAIDNIRIYSPLSRDAGVAKLNSPKMPFNSGIQAINISLANYGINTLTSTTLKWKVNGVAQASKSWTGSLAIGAVQENINLGNFNFEQGKPYQFKIWQENPNGQPDLNALNDTVYATLYSSLSGVYTIGGTSPDFRNFTEAVTVLNNAGVVGPVTFKVRNGTYNEQIVIGKVTGASATNTVTFESESGDSTQAVLSYFQDNSILDYTLLINGGEYLDFKNLGFRRSGNYTIIKIEKASRYINFTNCYFNSSSYASKSISIIASNNISIRNSRLSKISISLSSSSGGLASSDITIKDNRMDGYSSNDSYAIYLYGYYAPISKLQIESNTINGGKIYLYRGIDKSNIIGNTISAGSIYMENTYLNSGSASSLTGNIISNNSIMASAQTGNAITVSGYGVAEVSNNKISGVTNANGIDLTSVQGTLVANNFVQTQGLGTTYGISLNGGSNVKLVFNSIHTTGTDLSQARAFSSGSSNSNLTIKNNIFANSGGGYAAVFDAAPTGTNDIDYNNYYYSSGGKLGKYTSTDHSSLSSWGQAIGGDANSKAVNPFFKSNTELRAYQRALNGAGIPVPGVLLDIDGEIRNGSAPDIGADEFMVDFGLTRLVSPTLDCDQTASEPVIANIAQFGDIPFTDIKIAYQVNKGTIYTETVPGQINNDIEHTFQQVQNLLQDGRYDFKVWLVGIQDDNVNNDTLYVARFKKPRPVASFTFVTQCAGVAVPFQATASVTPGTIARYEWDFGDEGTATVQNPSHIYERSGTYTVTLRAYSEEGCYGSVTQTITITTTPEAKFAAANSCVGSAVTFKNESTVSAGTMTYRWDFGDGTSSTEQHPSKTYSQAGTYKVQLTTSNSSGCSNIYFKNVVINPLPTVTLAAFDPVCAEASAFNLTGGLPKGGAYSGVGVVDGMFSTATAGVGTHTITYTFTNENGCIGTATNTIQVKTLPTVTFTGLPASLCAGAAAVTLTASPAGGVWVGNGMNKDGVFTPATAGAGTHTIEYIYTDAAGCTNKASQTVEVTGPSGTLTAGSNSPVNVGGSLTLTATTLAGATYSWTGPNSFASASQNPAIANVTSAAAGTYTVTATLNGCSTTATVVVSINQPAVLSSFSPASGTVGTTVTIKGSGFTGATGVQFNNTVATYTVADDQTITTMVPAGSSTGLIRITTPTDTVSSSSNFTVLMNTITVTDFPDGTTYCMNASIRIPFTVTGTFASGNIFTAQLCGSLGENPINIGTLSGTDSDTITATIPAGATAGSYYVRVIASDPVVNGAPFGKILVGNYPPATPGSVSAIPYVCAGAQTTFSIAAVSGATAYTWTIPAGWTITAGQGTTSIRVIAGNEGGLVSVTASNTCGSSSSPSAGVKISTPATPAVSASTPQVGGTLNLTASTISGATYSWAGPNGFTSSDQNPTQTNVTAAMAGTYSVTATVNGCTSAAAAVAVTVKPANPVTLAMDSVSGIPNAVVLLPVRVKEFKNILSMQGSIQWNSSVASFVGVDSLGLTGLESTSFGQTAAANGQLSFSWHEAASIPVTLADDAIIFALKMRLSGAPGTSTAVTITSAPVPVEVSDSSYTAVPVTIKAGAVIINQVVTVTGVVKSQLGTPLSNVLIKATGGSDKQDATTTASGAFSFQLTEGNAYTVAPARRRETDATNGVTTLDLVQIQRHILNMQPLDSPYRFIAADANNSGSVTTLDVALIRALILHNISAFPNGRMWAFVKTDYAFADPARPFPYDSTRRYSQAAPLSGQDFIGIKLGDVNESWDAARAKTRIAGDLFFQLPDRQAAPGTEVVVPVSVRDFSDVSGYQFTLSWDPQVLAFAGIDHAGLEGVYGTHSVAKGRLTTVWADAEGKSLSLADGTKVFGVRFKVVGQQGAESAVAINSALTRSVAYTGGLEQLNVQARPALVKVKGPAYALYQNYPNPFSRQTTLHFELPEAQPVRLTIYNALGQAVKELKGSYGAGEHFVTWEGDDAQGNKLSKGAYYCRMQAGKFTDSVQIILAE